MKENEKNKEVEEEKLSPEEQIAKLQADCDHWKNEFYRAYADMQNLRKDVEKDHHEAIKYRAAGFIENLLPILDGFHMALGAEAKTPEMQAFLTGFEFIYKNLISALENEGVKELSPKAGDEFDPNTMSAIETQYTAGPANRVIKVNMKGYKLHDRLIRPSIVVVSTDKKDEKEESPKMDA